MPARLTAEIVSAAILGFEERKRQIDIRIGELRAMLPGGTAETAATPGPTRRKRRKMSAAGRKAIAEAQRKRWAESRKAAEPAATQEAAKPERKLTKAGRKAIVAATKKRWARVRMEAAKAAPAAARSTAVKRSVARKSAPKKTAPAPAPTAAETLAQ